MSLALASGPSARRLVTMVALGACTWLSAGCFDSDEKYQPAADATTTTGPSTTTAVDSTTTTGESSTTEAPEKTCQDAIECVIGCALELQTAMLPEPDLTCFLECEQGLNTAEVLHLFDLTECVTNYCIAAEQCDVLLPSDSSSSSSSSSSSTTGEGSTTSDTDGTRPNICLTCILGAMQDESTPGCMDLHGLCI